MRIAISCIIVNYNTANFTLDCVASIFDMHQSTEAIEVIVVDNASEKKDYLLLKTKLQQENFPNTKLIRSKQNFGFGAGNMIGINAASNCEYYAFINNDTLQLTDNCLWILKEFMDSTPDAGVCSPQMLDEDKKFRSTIDHFSSLSREILKRSFLEKVNPKKYPSRKNFFHKPTIVNYVQGSFMFFNAEDFNEIGGFDTNLFLFYEESDLGLRLLKERKKYAYIFPETQYIHFKSISIKKNINILIKRELKISLLYHTYKHYGFFAHQFLLNFLRIRYGLTSIVKPKYFQLFKLLIRGAHLSESLKQKQSLKKL
ncbi:glycosyltransferase family 2 protein [Zunongwangia endophytica]|uniref:Glycosyltransferase family 2 protein n=1 Tax=Zunongwangia endophytica TaxID=1808945 RepID=A0ABV8HF54_9FLAO|nr:glycosyltransferase family 2 protein [Zunongwangia endophytica]MDN3593373.1 glycosyltransferase family 2 protein [Zunongwangia endophytica]